MDIPEFAIEKVFSAFDINRDGSVNYDEFLRTIRGELNEFRRNLVIKAFKVMDKDGSGIIDINDIRGVYNAKFHPDVINKKRTEE